ncbi:MAG: T9SS type A sorting domain-containing protein, partial [Saprospiraceae bacterium]|nr:T9SS type A sorting domain-containing protein [Saprospiraceae bacterium]
EIEKLKDNKCPSEQSGLITAKSLQSKLPLDFNWSNGTQRLVWVESDTLKNLSGGTFNVTITDSDGCISISPVININAISSFTYSADIVKNLCNSDSSATITLQTGGASLPHTVEWQNGVLGFRLTQLHNGSYFATVTDALGCNFSLPAIAVSSISDISINVVSTPTAAGKKDGSLQISASGGQGNYSIEWSKPSLSGFNITGLGAGDYHCTVTDELGCQRVATARVDEINGTNEDSEMVVVQPNPTSNFIYFSLGNSIPDEMVILNLEGRQFVLPLFKLSQNQFSIDVSSLSSGIYFIKLMSKTKCWVSKFIKI